MICIIFAKKRYFNNEINGLEFLEEIEEEDEKDLETEMEKLIELAGIFYDREMERYEE